MTVDSTRDRSRRWAHTVAVAVMWAWGAIGGVGAVVGAWLMLTADPSADELAALPWVVGCLLVASAPFGVLVIGLGLRALRPGQGHDSGRASVAARLSAAIALVPGVVVLVASAAGRLGDFSTGTGVWLWFATLWPAVVLPAAVSTLVALATRPHPAWVARRVVARHSTSA